MPNLNHELIGRLYADYMQTLNLLRQLKEGKVTLDQVTVGDGGWQLASLPSAAKKFPVVSEPRHFTNDPTLDGHPDFPMINDMPSLGTPYQPPPTGRPDRPPQGIHHGPTG